MKFYVGSKQTGNFFKNEIRKTFDKNGGFISLAEVRYLFRETPNEDDTKHGWVSDSDLGKKIRVRECKDGWYLYLPDPNAEFCFDKKKEDNEKFKAVSTIEPPDIDVTVFETETFEKLVKAIDNIRLSMDGMVDRIIERWINYEADVFTGFEKLGEVIGGHYGYFYRPCIVKAKKSGRKEERQDRKAKFHRWADLSKGVQQVVAIVEFDDGHIEQVQPDRVIFMKVNEEVEEND